MKEKIFGQVLRALPKNVLSHWVGELVHTPLPRVLARKSVAWFAERYKINLEEAERPIHEYKTIGELFTRNLKKGVRPIHEGVIHPVDGRITAWGPVKKNTLVQAKGRYYSCSDFLGSQEWARKFENGLFLTYYLCPTDYHQIHSPVEGEVIESHLIPGRLWPVNDWSVNSVPDLFAVNERVVTLISTSRGVVGLVMVGATNVGKMTVSYDRDIISNRGEKKALTRTYSPGRPLKKGDKLGVFHMGSTVVMLYPEGYLNLKKEDPSGPAKLGETLGLSSN